MKFVKRKKKRDEQAKFTLPDKLQWEMLRGCIIACRLATIFVLKTFKIEPRHARFQMMSLIPLDWIITLKKQSGQICGEGLESLKTRLSIVSRDLFYWKNSEEKRTNEINRKKVIEEGKQTIQFNAMVVPW